MQLSDEIINAFVKTLPNGEKDNSNGYELYYGTVKVSNGKTSVILDGSPVETPLNYLTMGAENGDRVTCIIKDHSLIVTGNLTHPSEGMTTKYIETMTVLAQEAAIGKLIATEGDFTELTADSAFVKRLMSDQVGASILTADEAFVGSLQTQIVTADKIKAMQAEIGYVDAETLEANYIDAETIKANYVDTKTLHANYIDAETLKANYVDTETLKANYVNIKTLEANYIDANTIKANYVDTKTLKSDYIDAKTIAANYVDTETLEANYIDAKTIAANYVDTETLEADYIDAETIKANYMDAATIKAGYLQADMANLKIVEATKASIATLLANIALVKNATISQGHITGALDSVTLNANYITAGSLSVDRLYINGSDGKPRLVKFDSSGKPVATTIDASILTDRTVTADKIVANSITANEISTDFITAFRADIMQTVTEHLEAIDAEIQNLISGDTTITSLTVKSNASIGGKLTVTGSTILKGSVTMNSTLNVDGALTAKSLKLATPLPETSGGTGVNNFNNLFKIFRDRDYRLNYTRTNLINPTAQTQTKNGVTLTNNGDGTYTVNGTASEWTFFNLNYVNSSTLTIPVGTYKLTGTPTPNGQKVRTQVVTPDKVIGTNQNDYDGTIFTVQQGTAATWVRIAIDKGYTANNLLFKPMITTDLNATYGDFVQYSGPGELNENVAEIYKVSDRVSDETHTNLINPTAQTQTVNGVKFTNNGDGTYTVNGTASAEALIVQPKYLDLTPLRNKDIKIVGCPSGGGASKYQFNINIYDGSGTNIGSTVDFGEGKTRHVPSNAHKCNIVMVVRNGYTANNLLFKPMITTDLNATYDDFVQYSGDGELNENVQKIYRKQRYVFITTNEISATYNPMTIAEEMLAKRGNEVGPELMYVGVSDTRGYEQYAPASYTTYEIRRSTDTVTINTISYSNNFYYTNGRSAAGNWKSWKIMRPTDAKLDSSSENPIANKAVTNEFSNITKRTDFKQGLLDLVYPVGSIYTSTKNVSPATFLGGTWTRIKDTFLLAAGDTYAAGTTGGSSTHTLTVDEIPSHAHGLNNHVHSMNGHTHGIPALSGTAHSEGGHTHGTSGKYRLGGVDVGNMGVGAGNSYTLSNPFLSSIGGGAHTHSVTTDAGTTDGNSTAFTGGPISGDTTNTGGGKAHSIMPPYKVVYVWERTA